MTRLVVTLRHDLSEVEDGKGFSSVSAELNWTAAGHWSIAWPSHEVVPQTLLGVMASGEDLSRWGVVVREEGSPAVLWSGPIAMVKVIRGSASGFARDTVVCYGIDDTAILGGYLAFPDPASDVATSAAVLAASHRSKTGPGETVLLDFISENLGASALARRQVPGLVVPATLGRGTSRTYRARFDTLLDVARRIAVLSGVGVRLVQGDTGELLVEPSVPTLRPDLIWSVEAGTLAGVEFTRSAASTTDVIAGGRDDLTARKFVRSADNEPTGGWAFSRERFADATSSADDADLKQSADEQLAEGVESNGVVIHTSDASTYVYGTDYALGDLVDVSVFGVSVRDRLERLVIAHSDAGAPRIVPSVGEWTPERQQRVASKAAASLRRR